MAIAAVLKTAVRKDFWVRIPGPPLHTHRGSPPHTARDVSRRRTALHRLTLTDGRARGTAIASDTRRCLAPPRRTRDISRSLGPVGRREGDVAERLKATVC